MASPVDTSVKFLHSRMSGAPVLSGTAGSLVALLTACLVEGFDLKTATSLTVASGVATLAYSGAHSSEEGSVLLIAGVAGGPTGFAGMNGEQKLTGKPTSTSVTFATALPDGTYTGTITFKMAPLGWLRPYTGTNKAVYQSTDITSTKCLLRVDDAGTTTARVIGYETMTDVDTGVGPFPSTAHIAGGGYWPKSVNANSTAADWALCGDGRLFYISILPGASSSSTQNIGTLKGFGDPISVKTSGDPYFCTLAYSVTSSVAAEYDGDYARGSEYQIASPRSYIGYGTAQRAISFPYIGSTLTGISGITNDFGVFPNAIDGGMFLTRRYLRPEGTSFAIRGDLPGLWTLPQTGVYDWFRFLDVIPGAGPVAGKRMRVVPAGSGVGFNSTGSNTATATVLLDTTGPWR